MANSTTFKFSLFPNESFKGLREVLPSALAFANNGDSDIFFLIITDATTSTLDKRKGIRQPQLSQLDIDMEFFVPMITPNATTTPKPPVNVIQDVQNPRLFTGECSATKVAAPPNSPPMASPCKSLKVSTIIG